MNTYHTRKIVYNKLVEVNDWKIKIYAIAKNGDFGHEKFYQNALKKLPEWLAVDNGFDSSNDKIGFLILHEGKEGIFSLINWWVGENMLNTNIFITNPQQPTKFEKISGNGLGPCVWELEVVNHERVSWTNHILRKMPNPDYQQYLNEVINKEL